MRHNALKYEVKFYDSKLFSIEGAVFYDAVSDTYITSIEVISDGKRIELFNKDYIDFEYAKKAIHRKYRQSIQSQYRRLNDAKKQKEDD